MDNDGVPPMPNDFYPPGWEGYCTFNTPGTYEFFCQAHGGMDGHRDRERDRDADADADRDRHAHRDSDRHAHRDGDAHATATPTPPRPPPRRPRPRRRRPRRHPDRDRDTTRSHAHAGHQPRTGADRRPAGPDADAGRRAPEAEALRGDVQALHPHRHGLRHARRERQGPRRVSYRVGSKSRKKTLSLTVKNGRFSGKLKLSAGDARRAKKLAVTVTYGREQAKRTVKVSR